MDFFIDAVFEEIEKKEKEAYERALENEFGDDEDF